MAEWFEDWFESATYLSVYQHRNEEDAKALLNTVLNAVSIPGNATILDMACGAGRHSILLAQEGYDVTGVDLSNNLLSIASDSANKLNLNIIFKRFDLRELALSKTYDLILNVFTSFGYFTNDQENFQIFKNAYEHLKKDGYFVFDFFNREYLIRSLIPYSEDEFEDILIKQHRTFEDDYVKKRIIIEKNSETREYCERVKVYPVERIEKELQNIGFIIEKRFGNYQGAAFDEHSSQRYIAVCKKM